MKLNKKLFLLVGLSVFCMVGCNHDKPHDPGEDNPPVDEHTHTGGTATCSETAICDICHEHYGELGDHNYGELHPAVLADCDNDGNIAYYQCSVCHKYFNEQKQEVTSIVVAKSHTYGTWISEQAATCTTEGVVGHYHCTKCGKDLDEDGAELATLVIPALGHAGDPGEGHYSKYNESGKPCSGTYTYDEGYECTRCHNVVIVHEHIQDPTNGHDYVYTPIVGTETHTATCQRESCHEGDEGHSFVENCTYGEDYTFVVEGGKLYKQFTCTVCGGHKLAEVEDKVYTPTEAAEFFTEELIGLREIFDYKITISGTVTSAVLDKSGALNVYVNEGEHVVEFYKAELDATITEDFTSHPQDLVGAVVTCTGYPEVYGYDNSASRTFELVGKDSENAIIKAISDKAYVNTVKTYVEASLAETYAYSETQVEPTSVTLFSAYTADGKNIPVTYTLADNCSTIASLEANTLSFLPGSAKRTVIVNYEFTVGAETITGTLKSVVGGEELPAGGTDTLTAADTSAVSTTYVDTADIVGASGAHYAVNSAKNNAGSIQVRSDKNSSGIVSTKSGGKVKSVTITWDESTTAARIASIYASNTAYTNPTDLYSGTAIAELKFADRNTETKETTYTFTTDYSFVGIRSKSGAQYWTSVEIVWESEGFVEAHECSFEQAHDETHHWVECSVCHDIKGEKEEHTFADCGCTEFKVCSVCGQEATVKGSQHNLGTLVAAKAPTCTEAGNIAYYECQDCHKLFNEDMEEISTATIAALGHEKGTHHDATEADCEHAPTCEYWECSRCHEMINDAKEVIETEVCGEALGHDYVIHEAVAATCTEDGHEEYYSCSRCSKLFKKVEDEYVEIDAIPVITKTGHNYIPTVTDPTCEDKGYTTYVCSKCGDEYVDDEVAATGHTYVHHDLVPAEVGKEGMKEHYTCSVCGEFFDADKKKVSETELVIAPLGANVQVGETWFESLEAAVDSVSEYTTDPVTIVVAADLEGKGIIVDNKNIVIDLAGHTYTVNEAVGSTGTETLGFQLLKGSNVTIKNGELKRTSDSNVKMMIQNYCNTVLEDIVIDMSEESMVKYVVSNNCGSLLIKGNTEIIAAEGKVAIDAWYGMFEAYDEGVSVKVDSSFTGLISGIVEYGAKAAGAARNANWMSVTSMDFSEVSDLTKLDITFAVSASIEDIREANIALPTGMAMSAEGTMVEAEASINGHFYATLTEAIAKASDGDTVTLEKDVTVSSQIVIEDTSMTLDMNGHDFTATTPNGVSIFRVNTNGQLTINGDENSTFAGIIGLFGDGATVVIDGGTYVSHVLEESYVFSVSGNLKEGQATLTIKNATVTGSEFALYLAGNAEVTVENSVISGPTGIYMKAGILSVVNSTVNGTGEYADPVPNGNGASTTGDGIIMDSKVGYAGAMELYVDDDSVITSAHAFAIREAITDEETSKTQVLYTTGTLSGEKGQIFVTNEFSSNAGENFYFENVEAFSLDENFNEIYDSFANLLAHGYNSIGLLKDVEYHNTIVVTNDLMLVFSDETLSFVLDSKDAYAFEVNGGQLSMVGGTYTSNGKGIKLNSGEVRINSTFTATGRILGIYGGYAYVAPSAVLTSSGEDCTIFVRNDSELLVTGKVINNGANFAISGSGNDATVASSPVVTIEEGAYIESKEDVAMYWPCAGSLTITGGTFKGATALYVKCGTVSVSGATFIADGAAHEYNYNGNGANPTGDAIVLDNCNYPAGIASVAINDAKISSANGEAIACYAHNAEALTNYLAENATLFICDEFTYVTTGEVFDKATETFYATFEEALEAEAAHIVLVKDVALETTVGIYHALVLDMNGHDITLDTLPDYGRIVVRDGGSLVVNGDANSTFTGTIGINTNNTSLTINGGNYVALLDDANISVNGTKSGITIVVKDANLTATAGQNFYLAGGATTTITNTTMTADTGIYMKAGSLVINSSTITATGNYHDPVPNGNGSDNTGDAIILDSKVGYQGNMSVTVSSDSTISSANAYAIREAYTDAVVSATVAINLNSATLTGAKGEVFLSSHFLSKLAASTATFSYSGSEAYGLVNGDKIYGDVDVLTSASSISLLKDATMSSVITVAGDFVLDLNGHTLTATVDAKTYAIEMTSGTLTINGGNFVSSAKGIHVADGTVVINANITAAERVIGIYGGTVTVNAGKVLETTTANDPTVFVTGSSTLTVMGSIKNDAAHYGISGNGNDTDTSLTVTIKEGASVESALDSAIYWPNAGSLVIEGGSIKGATALYIKSGVVTISGGTFTATGAATALVHSNNGSNPTGDAIVVENCGYPSSEPVISLAGITFVVTDPNAKEVGTYGYGDYQPLVLSMSTTKTYSYTFNESPSASQGGGTLSLGGVDWSYSASKYTGFDSSKGVQFGSGSSPIELFDFTTDELKGVVTKVKVNVATGSKGATTIKVFVGGVQFGSTATAGPDSADYIFEGNGTGLIDIQFSDASKATYIKTIEVSYGEVKVWQADSVTVKQVKEHITDFVSFASSYKAGVNAKELATKAGDANLSYVVKEKGTANTVAISDNKLTIAKAAEVKTYVATVTIAYGSASDTVDFEFTVDAIGTYNMNVTEATAHFYASIKEDDGGIADTVIVTGVYTVESNKYYVVTGSDKIQLYDNAIATKLADAHLGDTISVTGNFKLYYSTLEITDVEVKGITHRAMNVTVDATEHGSVTLDKAAYVCGETVTGTVAADANYSLSYVKVNGENVDVTNGTFSFVVLEDSTISAAFAMNMSDADMVAVEKAAWAPFEDNASFTSDETIELASTGADYSSVAITYTVDSNAATLTNGKLSLEGLAAGSHTLVATFTKGSASDTKSLTFNVSVRYSQTFVKDNMTGEATTGSQKAGTITGDAVTITFASAYATGSQIRFYADKTVTFEASAGLKIYKISFIAAESGNKPSTISSDVGEYNTTTFEWTGSSSKVVITPTVQVRVSSITVITDAPRPLTDAEKVAYEKANLDFGSIKDAYTVEDTIELPTRSTGAKYKEVTVSYTLDDTPVTSSYQFTEAATDLSLKAVFTCNGETDSLEIAKITVNEKGVGPVLTEKTVKYDVTSTTAVSTSQTAPNGSKATYASTYGTKCQLTGGNSMTLTLEGFGGCKITGITLSMKSNSKGGAGSFSALAGSTTIASITGSAFNTANWYGAWSGTNYVDVTVAMSNSDYLIQDGENVVLTISASANSLYCQSFTITYLG